jgi:preprotein translocase subunit SecF
MGRFSRLGNDLYEGRTSIDFVGRRWVWYAVSALIIVASALGIGLRGFDLGIEFVGGAEYKVTLPASKVTQDNADRISAAVDGLGIKNAESPIVTTSGTNAILVRTQPLNDAQSAKVVDTITSTAGVGADAISQTEIGASWGREVMQRSLIGLAVFLVLVVLFIWAYFREWKMSVAAIVALAHDVLITVGVYALSGFEVTPATVTGVLTILGFSLYDTVVVFDKVRENTRNLRAARRTYAEAANLAVNQTLVRSINTSIVALIPVAAILYVGVFKLGSGSLKDLALALFVGMAAGAYSSIFIATPLLVQLKAGEKDLQALERRAESRRRAADPYAAVPAFSEDMPVEDEPEEERSGARAVVTAPDETPRQRLQPRKPTPGLGRTVPPAHGPVQQSRSAGRAQPTRESRAKRGKK